MLAKIEQQLIYTHINFKDLPNACYITPNLSVSLMSITSFLEAFNRELQWRYKKGRRRKNEGLRDYYKDGKHN